MKKSLAKKLAAVALTVIMVGVMAFTLVGCNTVKVKAQEYTTDNQNQLKIGIISDTQLSENKDSYYYNYVSALKFMKEQGVDTIIFPGDLTDVMTKKAAKNAKEAWEEVFGGIDKGPIKNYIMGNHDFWLPAFFDCWDIPSKGKMEKRFETGTGEKANSHKVINGYHFINASPSNGDMAGAYDKSIGWIEEEIKKAVAADDKKPIFVNTHFAPKGTVTLSEEYGEAKLHELFVKYPQVVSLSGHSHASLMGERSIWQGEYTAVQTQSLSYTCFEEENIANMFTFDEVPTGMIMTLDQASNMTIKRYNTNTGTKIGYDWYIAGNIADNLSTYSDATRQANIGTPYFAGGNIAVDSYNGKHYIHFTQAVVSGQSNIKYYHVKLKNFETQQYLKINMKGEDQESLRYISDFYNPNKSKTAVLELAIKIPAGTYEIEVVAEEEFGKKSIVKTNFIIIR